MGVGGGGACVLRGPDLCGDHFWSGYRNGKLICTYGAFKQKEK